MHFEPGNRNTSDSASVVWSDTSGLGRQLWKRVQTQGLLRKSTLHRMKHLPSPRYLHSVPLAADIAQRWGADHGTEACRLKPHLPLLTARYSFFSPAVFQMQNKYWNQFAQSHMKEQTKPIARSPIPSVTESLASTAFITNQKALRKTTRAINTKKKNSPGFKPNTKFTNIDNGRFQNATQKSMNGNSGKTTTTEFILPFQKQHLRHVLTKGKGQHAILSALPSNVTHLPAGDHFLNTKKNSSALPVIQRTIIPDKRRIGRLNNCIEREIDTDDRPDNNTVRKATRRYSADDAGRKSYLLPKRTVKEKLLLPSSLDSTHQNKNQDVRGRLSESIINSEFLIMPSLGPLTFQRSPTSPLHSAAHIFRTKSVSVSTPAVSLPLPGVLGFSLFRGSDSLIQASGFRKNTIHKAVKQKENGNPDSPLSEDIFRVPYRNQKISRLEIAHATIQENLIGKTPSDKKRGTSHLSVASKFNTKSAAPLLAATGFPYPNFSVLPLQHALFSKRGAIQRTVKRMKSGQRSTPVSETILRKIYRKKKILQQYPARNTGAPIQPYKLPSLPLGEGEQNMKVDLGYPRSPRYFHIKKDNIFSIRNGQRKAEPLLSKMTSPSAVASSSFSTGSVAHLGLTEFQPNNNPLELVENSGGRSTGGIVSFIQRSHRKQCPSQLHIAGKIIQADKSDNGSLEYNNKKKLAALPIRSLKSETQPVDIASFFQRWTNINKFCQSDIIHKKSVRAKKTHDSSSSYYPIKPEKKKLQGPQLLWRPKKTEATAPSAILTATATTENFQRNFDSRKQINLSSTLTPGRLRAQQISVPVSVDGSSKKKFAWNGSAVSLQRSGENTDQVSRPYFSLKSKKQLESLGSNKKTTFFPVHADIPFSASKGKFKKNTSNIIRTASLNTSPGRLHPLNVFQKVGTLTAQKKAIRPARFGVNTPSESFDLTSVLMREPHVHHHTGAISFGNNGRRLGAGLLSEHSKTPSHVEDRGTSDGMKSMPFDLSSTSFTLPIRNTKLSNIQMTHNHNELPIAAQNRKMHKIKPVEYAGIPGYCTSALSGRLQLNALSVPPVPPQDDKITSKKGVLSESTVQKQRMPLPQFPAGRQVRKQSLADTTIPVNAQSTSNIMQSGSQTVLQPTAAEISFAQSDTELGTEINSTETESPALPSGIDMDELVEKTWLKIMRKLTIERERRGHLKWS